MKLASPQRLLLILVAATEAAVTAASPNVASTIRYCNRGYCFTRKESEQSSGTRILSSLDQVQHQHTRSLSARNNQNIDATYNKRTGLDFCTDSHGQVLDCEIFEILGMAQEDVDVEFESIEPVIGSGKQSSQEINPQKQEATRAHSACVEMDIDEGIIDLDKHEEEITQEGHVSWKQRPQRGRCIDNDLRYAFDCNLIEILDEGLVLIEDLRAGGVFAAQPKSGFTTRRSRKHFSDELIRIPEVLSGSGPCDPMEDFRTNIFMNLEGF